MKFLPFIITSLGRKKIRATLTFLSVTIAFILFGLLGAVQAALNQGVDIAGADRLIVRHKVSIIQMLPVSYKSRIEQIEGVDLATHFVWFGGNYQGDAKNFFPQMPVIPDELLDLYPEYQLPKEQLEAWKSTRSGVIIGRKTATRFGWKLGDRVPIEATIWRRKGGEATWEFDVVGIYDSDVKGADLTNFFFRYDYFDETRQFGEGLVGWYGVRVEDPERADEIAVEIDQLFANSAYETKAEPEGAFLQGFAKQIGNITAIVVAIMSAVFFTILLVAGNTMSQSVRERIVELGVLKAIGFKDANVLLLILAESLTLTVAAGGIGLLLSWMMVNAMSDAVSAFFPVFYLPPKTLVLGFLLTAALGFVSGAIPAFNAKRLRIADALRR